MTFPTTWYDITHAVITYGQNISFHTTLLSATHICIQSYTHLSYSILTLYVSCAFQISSTPLPYFVTLMRTVFENSVLRNRSGPKGEDQENCIMRIFMISTHQILLA
jgi:hypothetical protein